MKKITQLLMNNFLKMFLIFPGLNTDRWYSLHISLSDLTCPLKSQVFSGKKLTLGKCSNFFVFQPILIKLIVESDLVLNRSFPEIFYDLMICYTPYAHISEKIMILRV